MNQLKYLILTVLFCVSFLPSQVYSKVVMSGWFHLICYGEVPFGNIFISNIDANDNAEQLLQLDLKMDVKSLFDSTENEMLIATICEKMNSLAQEYNVQEISLHLDAARITESAFKPLRELSLLKGLYIGGCRRLDSQAFDHLKELENLELFYFSGCGKMTEIGLDPLTSLTHLSTLMLSDCYGLDDEDLAPLKNLSNLQTLYLYRCSYITDRCFNYLMQIPNLRHILLRGNYGITIDGIEQLPLNILVDYSR